MLAEADLKKILAGQRMEMRFLGGYDTFPDWAAKGDGTSQLGSGKFRAIPAAYGAGSFIFNPIPATPVSGAAGAVEAHRVPAFAQAVEWGMHRARYVQKRPFRIILW